MKSSPFDQRRPGTRRTPCPARPCGGRWRSRSRVASPPAPASMPAASARRASFIPRPVSPTSGLRSVRSTSRRLVGHHAEQRADPRHHAGRRSARRSTRRCAGTSWRAVPLRLVEHGDDHVARPVHRERGGEGRDQRGLVVAARARLLGACRSCRRRGSPARWPCGRCRRPTIIRSSWRIRALVLALNTRRPRLACAGLDLLQRRRAPDAAVDHRRIGAGEVQRGDRDAVAVADGHRRAGAASRRSARSGSRAPAARYRAAR